MNAEDSKHPAGSAAGRSDFENHVGHDLQRQFVTAIFAWLENFEDLKKDGFISGKEKGIIQKCAAKADIP